MPDGETPSDELTDEFKKQGFKEAKLLPLSPPAQYSWTGPTPAFRIVIESTESNTEREPNVERLELEVFDPEAAGAATVTAKELTHLVIVTDRELEHDQS